MEKLQKGAVIHQQFVIYYNIGPFDMQEITTLSFRILHGVGVRDGSGVMRCVDEKSPLQATAILYTDAMQNTETQSN